MYQFPFAVVFATLTFAPFAVSVTFIVNVWADWLGAPSAIIVATRTWGQDALVPATKSSQALINEEVEGGKGITQFELTPFKFKSSNSTSPLENWNLTVLSKVTAGTVTLFAPSDNCTGFPKNQFPFAVVFATLTLAPFAVSVTFIVNVWDPWLTTESATVVATRT